jgi:ADP-heptose:LPS heptosyltransferase
MSIRRILLAILGSMLWLTARRRRQPHRLRILVIRRHRLGDMLYTLPLLQLLRRQFPHCHLAVACDPAGAAIARACDAVSEVVLLKSSWSRWLSLLANAREFQDYDWVLAAKGGFDRRLATLARLTNCFGRVGFERRLDRPSDYFIFPVALAPDPHAEHQIETLLRLLEPVGITDRAFTPELLRLQIPDASREFAARIVAAPPFHADFALVNISCNRPVKFSRADYAALIGQLLESTTLSVGIVAAPADQPAARQLAARFAPDRTAAIATPEALDLAALLERAWLFISPEGGAAHLSSATGTPTVVLWSGHYGKWRPRGDRHLLIEAAPNEASIPVERVRAAVSSLLFPPST